MPPRQLELVKASPAFPARLAAAHTLPRELRTEQQYRLAPARFKAVDAQTLLLLGSDSPSFFKAGIEAVHAALPSSRIEVLPGQQHIAMDTAPDLFVREVTAFLGEPGNSPLVLRVADFGPLPLAGEGWGEGRLKSALGHPSPARAGEG